MTTRATARRRAHVRRNTPLSALTTAVSEHAGSLGRGGAVLAMSSGLVASMAVPAQATHTTSGVAAPAPAVAPAAALVAAPALSTSSAPLADPFAQEASAPLTAPAAATVTFDSGAFAAAPAPAPKKKVETTSEPTTSRSTERASRSSTRSSASFGSAKGSSVIALAERYIGVPYVYGGTTPSGWDCSGAVKYIYGLLGVSLPRTSGAQYSATDHISRSSAQPGDLVFYLSGGSVYHVGIYAGGTMMYDAGRTGRVFSKREIFSGTVVFGRV